MPPSAERGQSPLKAHRKHPTSQRYNNYFNYANMSHKYLIAQIASGVLIPVLASFFTDTIILMIPWLITMGAVILADLCAGLWKSYKLEIPIRFSKACRDTMGKMIVYFAFVMMVCCINVAESGESDWGKWLTLLVIATEVGSIIANLLKPHGINISLNALVKAILMKSPLPITCEDANEIVFKESIERIRKEEMEKRGMQYSKPNKKKHEKDS